jgi:hypothetical protein
MMALMADPGLVRGGNMARFTAKVLTVALLVYAGAYAWVFTTLARDGHPQAVGMDVNAYLAHTVRWLGGGSWYLPAQLASPYSVEAITGNVYPPTALYLMVPFALGLPMVLWWAIPTGIVAFTYWRHRPAWWAWPILAAVFVYPRTWTVLLLGNPAMWAIALAVAGTAFGWPAWGATLKLTFAPLALTGIRRRSWWYGLPIALALALPFGSMWLDYLAVLRNTISDRGLDYVLGEWPIALALVAVAASHRVAPSARAWMSVGRASEPGRRSRP